LGKIEGVGSGAGCLNAMVSEAAVRWACCVRLDSVCEISFLAERVEWRSRIGAVFNRIKRVLTDLKSFENL
tara:strand:- start:121 stop:333 length:213 start_codon:yes stop_codon:yes gene_type:complete